MSSAVVDASVILAVLLNERTDSSVLTGAVVSAVNFSEVLSKTQDYGLTRSDLAVTLQLLAGIEPFTESQAYRSGELRPLTRAAGLSLGDRACLALALELNADVYTADRAWAALDLPCRIHLIR